MESSALLATGIILEELLRDNIAKTVTDRNLYDNKFAPKFAKKSKPEAESKSESKAESVCDASSLNSNDKQL